MHLTPLARPGTWARLWQLASAPRSPRSRTLPAAQVMLTFGPRQVDHPDNSDTEPMLSIDTCDPVDCLSGAKRGRGKARSDHRLQGALELRRTAISSTQSWRSPPGRSCRRGPPGACRGRRTSCCRRRRGAARAPRAPRGSRSRGRSARRWQAPRSDASWPVQRVRLCSSCNLQAWLSPAGSPGSRRPPSPRCRPPCARATR